MLILVHYLLLTSLVSYYCFFFQGINNGNCLSFLKTKYIVWWTNNFSNLILQQAAIMAAASAAGGGAYIGATPMAIATQLPPSALNGIGSPVVPSAPGLCLAD